MNAVERRDRFRLGVLLLAEGNVDRKGRATAKRAVQVEAAAHHFCQTLRDGQPETRAAEPPGCRGFGLGEGIENPSLVIRRNADPAVDYGQTDPYTLAILWLDPFGTN